jgi:hypothetical protein
MISGTLEGRSVGSTLTHPAWTTILPANWAGIAAAMVYDTELPDDGTRAMQNHLHSMRSLFDQLGLASDAAAIEQFFAEHRPLPGHLALHEATFWSSGQAEFLREEILDDADWAAVIDAMNAKLHDQRQTES